VVSSQVLVVHASSGDSVQVVMVVHAPALHMPQPETDPSLQRPDRGDHPVVLVPGVHCWHGFIGFTALASQHVEPIRHPAATG
jgi:hypothetical protein